MDNTSLALFIHELRNQCIYTEAAFRVFNQSLQEGASAGAFFAGQSILLSASQIGAILWPSRARAKSRGESLRSALNLGESHPLADRRLSCLWDFGDEKLEEWIFDTKGEQVIFDHLGPVPSMRDQAVPDLNLYRVYDPETRIFYFRGNGFKLQAIADAISDIFNRVTALHRQLLPDQYQPAPASSGQASSPIPDEAISASAADGKTSTGLADKEVSQAAGENGADAASPRKELKKAKKTQKKQGTGQAKTKPPGSKAKKRKPAKAKNKTSIEKSTKGKSAKSATT